MKKALAVLVVIGFVAMVATAVDFHPVKDDFVGWDTAPTNGPEGYSTDNSGAAGIGRAGKGWQNSLIQGYDKQAVLASMTAMLGHTPTLADFQSNAVGLNLKMMANAEWGGGFDHSSVLYKVGALLSNTDWSEMGASFSYSDNATQTRWNNGVDYGTHIWPSNSAYNGCLRYAGLDLGDQNILPVLWSTGDYLYQTFAIDPEVAYNYLTNPVAVALMPYSITVNGDGSWATNFNNNGTTYSKEGVSSVYGAGVYVGPDLVVTPEPCSMLLIAGGAVALIRRRK